MSTAAENSLVAIDSDDAIARFMQLTAIPGRSGDEAAVAAAITQMLADAGVDPDWIAEDDAHQRTRIKGNCGNLIVSLPGNPSLPRTLLSAHMDTVPICLNAKPVLQNDPELGRIVVAEGPTGLGGDDRSGCAVILTAVIERLRYASAHPDADLAPAVISFLIQEEVGLEGARHLDPTKIGKVDQAFNFDGGTLDKIRQGAIGGERMQATVYGYASHAGVAPEKGVSAIAIAAKAIAALHDAGLHGLIERDGKRGTANVGVIQGGEATNVVTPEVSLKIEARSHDAEFRTWIVSQIREALEQAAREVTDASGRCGRIEFSSHVDYEAFALDLDHPSVLGAQQWISRLGRDPVCEVANGGLDANWLFLHGIEAVTLGCGQAAIHTADEYLLVDEYLDACRLAASILLTN
ncbi:M20/M25/M40 family metallo-hydrolase [Rhodopirellula sp. SWK7]|uniref:M20/M25/M40 family metallo-hydrolase n=1 Tax=Rhodopirellula sp. SWK7 TaxID=595460 RepID=UPI0002BEE22A|nr:M20/M25/M40 family metallo-hydrolase [Rhodopirellula sp. SWK7]EMI47211.1 M20A family peptidase [Rhodopirellula sp. SWK7]